MNTCSTQATVLVVDDEPHIRRVLALKLEEAGHRVLSAGDGIAALELARAERPDLLITDQRMAGLSGEELCESLYFDPRTTAVPIMLLTAVPHLIDVSRVQRAGVVAVLAKPFSPRDIVAAVDDILAGRVGPYLVRLLQTQPQLRA